MFLTYSCGEPETTVKNIVHADGSVTRQIEIRSSGSEINDFDIQVPYDSTWKISDTIDITNGKDTTWIRMAEKTFRDAGEINELYKNGKSANSRIERSAHFKKQFRWFFTTVRFSEQLENTLKYGYPVNDYLSDEELEYFYLPDNISFDKDNGPDSARYKLINTNIENKCEEWMSESIVSEWIEEFSNIMGSRAGEDISRDSLKIRAKRTGKNLLEMSDSLLNSTLLGNKDLEKYKIEIDSANNIVENRFDPQITFEKYNVKFSMPGKVIATNGFIDSIGEIAWPVKSDYFFTEPYEMWAEAKMTNVWAWIVSGFFVFFVVLGLFIRSWRKKQG